MNSDNGVLSKYREHFTRIDQELDKVLSSRVTLIEDIGDHALLGQGKRLRPLFFVLSCQLCNYQGEDMYRISTIFECIHTASLLHDDVLDNAEVRRKKPSANRVWGNHAAVLEGDFLYSKSLAIALSSNRMPFLRRLTDTTIQMTEGQIMELMHTDDWNTSKEEYLDIITSKTSTLVSAACACAAIIAGSRKEVEQSLEKFGLNAGVAFQLMDDLLDYTSSQEMFGKPVGKDLKEGKITLPLIYTLSRLEKSEKERLENLFTTNRATDADYASLVNHVRSNGTPDRIRDEAQSYINEAAGCLSMFPDSPAKRNLLELNQYIIERKY